MSANGDLAGIVAGPPAPVVEGFGFTEGPIWHPTEHWLVFSDIAESRQYRWSEADGLGPFRLPSNQANGNCFDTKGRVVSCEHASSQLVRHAHGGKLVEVLAADYDGRELNSPNDVVCDARGRIWFTDPSFGRIRADLGILRDQEQPCQGVYRLDPDGTLALVIADMRQPNGLCFSNDDRRLFVNDSWGPHIRVFDVAEDGSLSGGAVWAEVTGEGEGVPDGMKCDLEGRIWCNGPGGVHVFSPGGAWIGRVPMPEKVTNFCWGGAGGRSLFVTGVSTLWRVETETGARPMIPGA
ncbi:MAG: SMP-30/gluconolactonase/LRE family protein [Deinococcus-Thermus bacterium]|jgi:gluconolactonase|nr:SMP-30/gluconolactonase/LRE family protein [Deinococcota bacterium]